MYIENIRNTIKSFSVNQYEEFLTKLRKILKYKYDTEIKPSELKIQVEKFIDHKTDKISVRYLEAYLLALSDIAIDGGLKAVLQGKVNYPKTWRDLFIIVTEDRPLPKDIKPEYLDEIVIKDIKLLFSNVLNYCAADKKDDFHDNIHTVNSFLSIKDLE